MKSIILIICFSVVLLQANTLNNNDEHNQKHSHHNVHSSNRHHHIKSQAKHHGVQHPFHQTNRVAPQQYCHYVCSTVPPSSNTSAPEGLQINYNGDNSLFAVVNNAANVALVIDYSSNISAIFNGQSGITLVLDESSNQLYRLSTNSSNADNPVWQPSKETFDAYFKRLTSLKDLLKLAQQSGEKIDAAASPDLDQAVSQLGASLSSQEALKLIASFTAHLRGSLKLLFGSSGSLTTTHGLRWIISVSISASDLLDLAEGGLNSTLSPDALLKANSGVEGLVRLLGQIGEHVDLAKAFSHLWQSPDRVAQLLGQASTGSHNGIDGLISVLISIWEVIRGQDSINAVITNVLNYNASSSGDDTSLADLAKLMLEVFEAQNRQYNNNAVFSWYVGVLRALIDSNLMLNGVNVSDIVKILTSPNPSDRISTIVRILSLFNPVRAIPQFFKYVVGLLNSTNNTGVLSRLIPGVDLSNFTGPGTIFQNILHGQDFASIISNPWNATEVLSRIPVFGQIFDRFSSYLGNGFDINKLLNGSNFLGGFQNALGGNGSFGNVISSFTNATSSIPAQIEHGISGFVSGIEGALGGAGGQASSNSSESGQVGASTGQGQNSSNSGNSSISGTAGISGNSSNIGNIGGVASNGSSGSSGSSSGGIAGSSSGNSSNIGNIGGTASNGSSGSSSGGIAGSSSGNASVGGQISSSDGSSQGGSGAFGSGGQIGFSDKKAAKEHHHKKEEKRKHVKKTEE